MKISISKIISIFLILSLSLDNAALALGDIRGASGIRLDTLQVPSFIKPITDEIGASYDRQIRLELAVILSKAFKFGRDKNKDLPYWILNGYLDQWYSPSSAHNYNPFKRGEPLCSVITARVRDGLLVLHIEVEIAGGNKNIFRVETSSGDLMALLDRPGEISVKKLSEPAVRELLAAGGIDAGPREERSFLNADAIIRKVESEYRSTFEAAGAPTFLSGLELTDIGGTDMESFSTYRMMQLFNYLSVVYRRLPEDEKKKVVTLMVEKALGTRSGGSNIAFGRILEQIDLPEIMDLYNSLKISAKYGNPNNSLLLGAFHKFLPEEERARNFGLTKKMAIEGGDYAIMNLARMYAYHPDEQGWIFDLIADKAEEGEMGSMQTLGILFREILPDDKKRERAEKIILNFLSGPTEGNLSILFTVYPYLSPKERKEMYGKCMDEIRGDGPQKEFAFGALSRAYMALGHFEQEEFFEELKKYSARSPEAIFYEVNIYNSIPDRQFPKENFFVFGRTEGEEVPGSSDGEDEEEARPMDEAAMDRDLTDDFLGWADMLMGEADKGGIPGAAAACSLALGAKALNRAQRAKLIKIVFSKVVPEEEPEEAFQGKPYSTYAQALGLLYGHMGIKAGSKALDLLLTKAGKDLSGPALGLASAYSFMAAEGKNPRKQAAIKEMLINGFSPGNIGAIQAQAVIYPFLGEKDRKTVRIRAVNASGLLGGAIALGLIYPYLDKEWKKTVLDFWKRRVKLYSSKAGLIGLSYSSPALGNAEKDEIYGLIYECGEEGDQDVLTGLGSDHFSLPEKVKHEMYSQVKSLGSLISWSEALEGKMHYQLLALMVNSVLSEGKSIGIREKVYREEQEENAGATLVAEFEKSLPELIKKAEEGDQTALVRLGIASTGLTGETLNRAVEAIYTRAFSGEPGALEGLGYAYEKIAGREVHPLNVLLANVSLKNEGAIKGLIPVIQRTDDPLRIEQIYETIKNVLLEREYSKEYYARALEALHEMFPIFFEYRDEKKINDATRLIRDIDESSEVPALKRIIHSQEHIFPMMHPDRQEITANRCFEKVLSGDAGAIKALVRMCGTGAFSKFEIFLPMVETMKKALGSGGAGSVAEACGYLGDFVSLDLRLIVDELAPELDPKNEEHKLIAAWLFRELTRPDAESNDGGEGGEEEEGFKLIGDKNVRHEYVPFSPYLVNETVRKTDYHIWEPGDPETPNDDLSGVMDDFDKFENINYRVLALFEKENKTVGDFKKLKRAMQEMTLEYLRIFRGVNALNLIEIENDVRLGAAESRIAAIMNRIEADLVGLLVDNASGRVKDGDKLPAAVEKALKKYDGGRSSALIVKKTEEYTHDEAGGITFAEFINIVHQKGVMELAGVITDKGGSKRELLVDINAAGKAKKQIRLGYYDARKFMNPPTALPMRYVAGALAKGECVNAQSMFFDPDMATIMSDAKRAILDMKMGDHSANIQFALMPVQEGGRVSVTYTDSGDAYFPGSVIRVKAIAKAFKMAGFKVERAGYSLRAVFDKDSGARSMDQLPEKLEFAVQALTSSLNIDMLVNGDVITADNFKGMLGDVYDGEAIMGKLREAGFIGREGEVTGKIDELLRETIQDIQDEDQEDDEDGEIGMMRVFERMSDEIGAISQYPDVARVKIVTLLYSFKRFGHPAVPADKLLRNDPEASDVLAGYLAKNGYIFRHGAHLTPIIRETISNDIPEAVQMKVRDQARGMGIAVPDGEIGQRALDTISREMRRLYNRGAFVPGTNEFHKEYAVMRDASPVRYFLGKIFSGNEADMEVYRKTAAVARALENFTHKTIIGAIGDYRIEKVVLPIVGDRITFYVMRNSRDFSITLATAVLGDFYYNKPRWDDLRNEGMPDNDLRMADLEKILRLVNMTTSESLKAFMDSPAMKSASGTSGLNRDIFSLINDGVFLDFYVPRFEPAVMKNIPSIAGIMSRAYSGGVTMNRGSTLARAAMKMPGKAKEDYRGRVIIADMTGSEDDEAIAGSGGIVVTTGGVLSHAALRARDHGKPGLILLGAEYRPEGKLVFEKFKGSFQKKIYTRGIETVEYYELSDYETEKFAVEDGDLVFLDGDNSVLYLIAAKDDWRAQAAHEAYVKWKEKGEKGRGEARAGELEHVLSLIENPDLLKAVISDIVNGAHIDPEEFAELLGKVFSLYPEKKGYVKDLIEAAILRSAEIIDEKELELAGNIARGGSVEQFFLILSDVKSESTRYTYFVHILYGNGEAKARKKIVTEKLEKMMAGGRLWLDEKRREIRTRAEAMPEGANMTLMEVEALKSAIEMAGLVPHEVNPRLFGSHESRIEEREREASQNSPGRIVWKEDIRDRYSRNMVGGKGSFSGELKSALEALRDKVRAKYPVNIKVPEGFAIKCDEYEAWSKSGRPGALDEGLLKELAVFYRDLVTRQAKDIMGAVLRYPGIDDALSRELVESLSKIEETGNAVEPTEMNDAILRIRGELENIRKKYGKEKVPEKIAAKLEVFSRVAVRSSGKAEDGFFRSLAGMKTTVLNSSGVFALGDAVIEVWKSGAEGVLVEEMVNGERSGVAFSSDPVTKRTDRVRINAGYGLAKGIVDQVISDPDSYLIEKPHNGVAEYVFNERGSHIGSKTRKVVLDPANNTTAVVPLDPDEETAAILSRRPVFDAGEAEAIAALVDALSEIYGFQVDVEFSMDNAGNIHIFQVRPITTINDSILDGKKFFFDFGGEKKPAVNVAETVMEHARGERAEGVSEKTIKETHKESHAAMVSLKKMLEEADKTGIHGDSSVSAPAAAGDEQPEDNEWQPLDPNWKPKELPGDLAGSVLNPGDPGKKGHKQSVDIVLDISLVPKMTEYDRDKYAGTLANLMKLAKKSAKGDINLVLKLPYEKNTETMPGTLLKDIDNAENAQALLTAVNKELGEGVTLESRPGAITVPIIGKSWLEWARDNGIKLEENEYPVALDGPTFIEGKGIAFRDLEAAFTIAICQASLAALKKRGVGMTAELAEARKKVIAELGDLYRTALGSDAYMEETITFLLHDDPRTRLRVAIALALPSAGRFDMRAFIDLNMFMRELVSAA